MTHHHSTPQIVTEPAQLDDACKEMAAAGQFAFDTEFVGEDTYHAQVCLVQAVCGDRCFIIDPLPSGLELRPFWELVADPSLLTIVHAGSEDLALCWKQIGKVPANIFDLQVAAGFVGLGYPTSLARLAKVTVNVQIHKSQTLTDWRVRPLTEEQLDYAALDVVYLPGMYAELARRLEARKRLTWAREECEQLCSPARFSPTPAAKIQRISGTASMSRRELAIAQALYEERDKLAAEYNRPVRAVIKDHILAELARRGWTDIQKMRTLRGMSLNTAGLKRLATVIEQASKTPIDDLPERLIDDDSPEEQVLTSLVTTLLRDKCDQDQLAYSLLATKKEIRALVRSHTRHEAKNGPLVLRSGWRGIAIGQLLDDVIRGEKAIRVIWQGNTLRLAIDP